MSLWCQAAEAGAYRFGGELNQELASLFVERLIAIGGGDVRLDLAELDIEDGAGAARH